MTVFRILLILGCVLFAAGCTVNPRTRAEDVLRDGGAEQLRADAARVYKEIFSGHGKPAFVEVWYKEWPISFQNLRPLHVGAYLDGISIALGADDRGEVGLYVVPKSMDHEPVDDQGTRFERLTDGIYWYSFHAKRSAVSPTPP